MKTYGRGAGVYVDVEEHNPGPEGIEQADVLVDVHGVAAEAIDFGDNDGAGGAAEGFDAGQEALALVAFMEGEGAGGIGLSEDFDGAEVLVFGGAADGDGLGIDREVLLVGGDADVRQRRL